MRGRNKQLLRIVTIGGVMLGIHWFTIDRMSDQIFGGRIRPVDRGFQGESTLVNTSLPDGTRAIAAPVLSDDGLAAAFVTEQVDGKAGLLLWTVDNGFVNVLPSDVKPFGSASISRDGNKLVFFGEQSGIRAPFIWEAGFGTHRISEVTCSGDWSAQLAGNGERLLLFPSTPAASCTIASSALASTQEQTVLQSALLLEFEPRATDSRYSLEQLPTSDRKIRVRALSTEPQPSVTRVTDANLLSVSSALRSTPSKLNINRLHIAPRVTASDVDGDGGDDLLMFSQREELPVWRAHTMSGSDGPTPVTSSEGQKMYTWRVGDGNGYPVPGDYNGDGILDLATFSQGFGSEQHESRGNWRIFLSQPPRTASNRVTSTFKLNPTEGYVTLHWGTGSLLPVPADYDGDGATDLAVFDDDSGRWQILFSGGGFHIAKAALDTPGFGAIFRLGERGDIPVVGDYDGDGRVDPAVWSPPRGTEERGQWKVRYLADKTGHIRRDRTISFGMKDDIPIAADYNCDGTTDLGVYRRAESTWIVRLGENTVHRIRWGIDPKEEPIVGDFDADGCIDLGFYFAAGHFRWALLHSQFGETAKDMLPNGLNVMTAYTYGLKDGGPPQLWLRKLYQRGR